MSDDILLPILPLKNTVLLPYVTMPLKVGRPASIAAVEAALASEEKILAAFTQRDAQTDDPEQSDLYSIGTTAVIRRMMRGPEGIELLIQGTQRVELLDLVEKTPHLKGSLRPFPVVIEDGPEVEALTREVITQLTRMQEIAQPMTQLDLEGLVSELKDPLQLVYVLGALASLSPEKAQQLLESSTNLALLKFLHESLLHELQVLEVQQQIAKRTGSEISKEQREYLLRQQMETIQKELGEQSPEEAEVAELRRRLGEAKLPEDVRKEADRELSRLERIPSAAPDFQVTRGHLELILELPWTIETTDNLDLDGARRVLDEDHYGLEDIKERIIEHLAVMKLNPSAHSPILCFVGPPGVGKTSLGQSIGRSLGRKFERMSLGGLHDEAELRGHRRTYIGAMPGRILQAIRRAGVRNPLLMLDEMDKLGRDYRGDPAAALMEILDPSQNKEFRDNYLDLPFDLSRVFFIATANTTDTIPRPLLDRMEVVRLSGYTEEEKLQIAKRYLLPRRRQDAGLTPEQFSVPDDVLTQVIRRYTREAGVRELERMLGSLARKVAARVAAGRTESVTLKTEDLADLLGPERFFQEQARQSLPPGVATGLAWTEAGGDVLYVEAVALPDEGRRLSLTGQLGNVMKESARAALSFVISHAAELGVELTQAGVHIHVPAGAIPKDGPSAGVTMATAIASLLTGHPTSAETAMTGEITLSGLVLPVGGIKEKALAARRSGIRRVILPRANEKDLKELPQEVREDMEFILAERIDDVLRAAIPAMASRPARADGDSNGASASKAATTERKPKAAKPRAS